MGECSNAACLAEYSRIPLPASASREGDCEPAGQAQVLGAAARCGSFKSTQNPAWPTSP